MGPENQGPEALIGQAIAGYRLDRVLGVGATGAVYFGTLLEDAPKRIERANMPPVAGPSVAAIKLLFVPWQLSATQDGRMTLQTAS
ncbi:MAG TPA: hypothetical protein VGR88_06245 [Ktedonobacterales bacterium]|nr:hypothetical protein [Ktedonobacterales bacterium]